MTAVAERPVETVPTAITDAKTFHRFVNEHLRDAASADPADIADKILGDLSDEECRVGLRATLTDYVRNFAGRADRQVRSAPVPQGTGRAARIRTWYAATLATRLLAGGEWKFLRDCTAGDLHEAAALRFKTAAATQAEGERWVRLADLVEDKGAETVADLSEEELRSVFEVPA